MRPKRTNDPFEDNEIKGTRMPEYAKVSRERDFVGELGWIPNFDVKKSKNNDKTHKNYKEFFDTEKAYHLEFTSGHVDAQDLIR